MEVKTPIAESIYAADQNAKYDAYCKKLLSEKMILAWIMKSCLEEYRDCSVKEIAEKYIEGEPQISEIPVAPDETNATRVRGIGNVDSSKTEGTVTYDIRFMATAPGDEGLIQLIINVEAQGKLNTGYPMIKRGIYYCSRMISAQYGTEFVHSEYQKIKKVYSIFVCTASSKKRQNTVTRYRVIEENLVGNVKEAVKNYDLLSVIILCLGDDDNADSDGILKLLNALLSSTVSADEKCRVLQDDFDIPMTEELKSEVEQLCNLSQGVEERGRIKGHAEGRAEGRAEGVLTSIRNLMANTGWTLEKAMEILGLPDDERPKYADLLQKQ